MQGLLKITMLLAAVGTVSPATAGDSGVIPPPTRSIAQMVRAESASEGRSRPERTPEQLSAYRAWKRSVIPVVASQALDVASSYGLRELNPLLADSSGRFGPKAASIKLGATAGALGLEYWIARQHPRAARAMSMINWSSSVLTSTFAVHNFAIR